MLRFLTFVIFLSFVSSHVFACDTAEIKQQLSQLESQTLLKNAPTFRHAWDDGAIKLDWTSIRQENDRCIAQMNLSLPEADLQQALQYMEQNAAKRILLAAQGYAVPDQTKQSVEFVYQLANGKVMPFNEGNLSLRQLHNNLEYTYQLLAQIRINVSAQTSNTTAWPAELKASEKSSCVASGKSSATACDCRVVELEKVISPRQKELVDFIRSQPYAMAAGSMDSFVSLSKQIDSRCGQ